MSCNLEQPKSWGAVKQTACGKAPCDGFPGCRIPEMRESTQRGEQPPSHSTVGLCWHSTASSDDGTGSRREGGREHCPGPGRISNGTEQKGNWIERTMHLYLLETAETHKPGDPLKASLERQATQKAQRRLITPSPHTLTPAQEPWSEKPGLLSQEMKTVVSAGGTAHGY